MGPFWPPPHAELNAEELAKLAQSPTASLISVTFRNVTNFDHGPEGRTQNILNIRPVIPVILNKDESDNQWTLHLCGGIGHILHLGRLPVNAQIGGYYNVVTPDHGTDWQLRAQRQIMFPNTATLR